MRRVYENALNALVEVGREFSAESGFALSEQLLRFAAMLAVEAFVTVAWKAAARSREGKDEVESTVEALPHVFDAAFLHAATTLTQAVLAELEESEEGGG